MAIWKSYRISDVVNEIDEGKFVLPVIQRRLVWDEEKMELLFDTLLKGDSFGGIMVIEEEKDTKPLFSFRPFTQDGSSIKSSQIDKLASSQYFVIDGQQRLQSFYIGLAGSINGKILFFDLFSNYNTIFEFKFENDHLKLPETAKDDSLRTVKEHCWYPVNSLLQKLKLSNNDRQVAKEIIKAKGISDENKKELVEENIAAFFRNTLSGECLGISKVAVDKNYDEIANRQRIVELFRRLNDGGTKLSSFDLVASILKGFDWRMESFIEDTLEEFKDINLDQDNFIKLLFLLQDNHSKEMTGIEATDTQFAIEQKERIKSCLISLRKFLQASELYNYFKEPNRSFIPLYFISYHLFHKEKTNSEIEHFFDNFDTGNADFPEMKKWIYYSLLNGIFKSRGAGWIPYKTGIRKILGVISQVKNKHFPVDELFKMYKDHGLTFKEEISSESLNAFDHTFIFYLIYDRRSSIRAHDIDHIHPKSLLEKATISWEQINHIGNYQLIDPETNRWDKNATPLNAWINTSVKDIPSYLKRHLIPEDQELWDDKNYTMFLNKRKNKIIDKLSNSF